MVFDSTVILKVQTAEIVSDGTFLEICIMNNQQNRQVRRTRQALLDAFRQLLEEKGYRSITVAEITKRADVGRSSFYRHFEDKRGILLALHSDAYRQWELAPKTKEGWLSQQPSPQMIALLNRVKWYRGSVGFMAEMGQESHHLIRQLEETLAEQIQQGLTRAFANQASVIPLTLLSFQITEMINGTLKWWFFDRSGLSTEEVAKHFQKLVRAVILEAYPAEGTALQ